MSCKCKNIIENFQGGTIPLDTIFNGDVQICGPGKSLRVSQIDGCSPTTIGSQSGCTSATTTVLIVSGKTNFSCDINTVSGGIFSGGTNLDQLFLPISATADTFVIAGVYIDSTGTMSLLRNDGNFVNITGLTDTYVTGGTISTSATDSNNSGQIGLFYKNADGTPRLLPFEDTFTTGGTFTSSSGILSFTKNDGSSFTVSGLPTDSDFVWNNGSSGNFSVKQVTDTTTDATGNYAVAEGSGAVASGDNSHAEGEDTLATGLSSHAEGFATVASEWTSHAEGAQTIASGIHSHSEGFLTTASGEYSHAEGVQTTASAVASKAEGNNTVASANSSKAEGFLTTASGPSSHSQNNQTKASGDNSHAGGKSSEASGNTSFIHSTNSIVTGDRSVVLGGQNITGTTNDTVYVPYLNINNLGTGTSINNLGIDSSGNVVTGFTSFDTFVIAGGYSESTGTLSLLRNDANFVNVTGITDTFTTGFTYSNNNFTISQNQGQPDLVTNISVMTGLTINGDLDVNGSLNIGTVLSGTPIFNLGIDSSGDVVSGITSNLLLVYTLGHDSISPTDNNDYFIGQNFNLTPSTSSNDGRRFIVQKTGTVTQVSIKKTITGTLGSSETNNFYVNNVTQATQRFITSGETFDSSSSLTNYTLSTPLNVTAGDKLEIEWLTPAWVTNPTSVRQTFNMIIEY